MKKPGSGFVRWSALAALLLAMWMTLGPYQLGGPTSFVITHGNSMEPRYHAGDLVLLHRADSYTTGDIIGYESPSLDRIVLHRVHTVQPDGAFVTQGDNNDWLDTDRPKTADVLGKEWLHLPGVGKWLLRARSPVGATVLVSLVALSFFLGREKKKRRGRSGRGHELPRIALGSFTEREKMILGGIAAVGVLCLMLGFVGFRQPLIKAINSDAAYEHVGDFSYSADVKESPVYPSGKVEPGRAIFLNLVKSVDVSFDYSLRTETEHSVKGEAMMFARVTGSTGWKKAVPIAPLRAFKGPEVRLEGTLDFEEIEGLRREVQEITGLPETGQRIELIPRIDIRGTVAGETISEQFAPELDIRMDTYQAQVEPPESAGATTEADGGVAAAFHRTQAGAVSTSETAMNRVNLLGLTMSIGTARQSSALGLVIVLLALGACWLRFSNPEHADEGSLIAAKYGDWLIPVASMQTTSRNTSVRVKSMEALVRLAELYERMILHEEVDGVNSYYVEEEGVLYFYRVEGTKPEVSRSPSSTPRFSGRKTREERRKVEVERLKKELVAIEAEVLSETQGPTED